MRATCTPLITHGCHSVSRSQAFNNSRNTIQEKYCLYLYRSAVLIPMEAIRKIVSEGMRVFQYDIANIGRVPRF